MYIPWGLYVSTQFYKQITNKESKVKLYRPILITIPDVQGYQNFNEKGKSLLDEDEGEKFLQTEVTLIIIDYCEYYRVIFLYPPHPPKKLNY